MRTQPWAIAPVTQSAVRFGWAQPRLAPPMYMLTALYGEVENQVASSVKDRAVQASNPWPVKVVSARRGCAEAVALVVPARARASAGLDGEITSAVASSKLTLSAMVRAAAASSPADTTTETGDSSAVTTRSGLVMPATARVVRWTAWVRPTRCGGQVIRVGSPTYTACRSNRTHPARPAIRRTGQVAGTVTVAPRNPTCRVSPVPVVACAADGASGATSARVETRTSNARDRARRAGLSIRHPPGSWWQRRSGRRPGAA